MDEELEAQAVVIGEVANRGNETAADDAELVSLLQPDFAPSNPLGNALGEHCGERRFIPSPFALRHFGGFAEFAALANDPAF